MILWLTLTILFAALEVFAVSRNSQRLEYVAKPAALICLFLWLYSTTGLQSKALWFGLGLLFSLVGDVLLISFEQLFLFGLIAFLLAHLSYITGFWEAVINLTSWSWILALFIALNIGRLLRRIVEAMRGKGESKLIGPVLLYGTIISLMLYAAMSTMVDPLWKTGPTGLVSLGALCFCASDAILAWNKFVSPIKNGRLLNISLYYLGQIGLIAGVIAQFR